MSALLERTHTTAAITAAPTPAARIVATPATRPELFQLSLTRFDQPSQIATGGRRAWREEMGEITDLVLELMTEAGLSLDAAFDIVDLRDLILEVSERIANHSQREDFVALPTPLRQQLTRFMAVCQSMVVVAESDVIGTRAPTGWRSRLTGNPVGGSHRPRFIFRIR